MNAELLVVAIVVMLLVGCGARGGSRGTKMSPEVPAPALQERSIERPEPAYGMPLDIRIDTPQPPQQIQGPSPPIPEGTPMPGGILSGWGQTNP